MNEAGRKISSEVLKVRQASQHKLLVYPNPFLSEIKITFFEKHERVGDISLYDIRGRLLYNWKNPGPLSRITLKVPPTIEKGKYLLKISTQSGIITHPVMKME